MNATSLRAGLYALALCVLANAPGYAAGGRQVGGQTGAGNDIVRKGQSALSGASASARRQPAARHAAGLTPKPGLNAPLGARSVLSKPAMAAARGYPPARPVADNRAGFPEPGPAAAHAVAAMSASALAGRASSNNLLAGGRSATTLKPQQANGVIGGPRAAGLGSIGGPANSRTVTNASINGSALRRRS